MISQLLKIPLDLTSFFLAGLKNLDENYKSQEFIDNGFIEYRHVEKDLEIEHVLNSIHSEFNRQSGRRDFTYFKISAPMILVSTTDK